LKLLKTNSYGVFAVYRILLAVFVWTLILARS
jgi:hypothetical protein